MKQSLVIGEEIIDTFQKLSPPDYHAELRRYNEKAFTPGISMNTQSRNVLARLNKNAPPIQIQISSSDDVQGNSADITVLQKPPQEQ